MTIRALSPWMVGGRRMARFAIRVRLMIKGDISPTSGIVTARTLPRPMAARSCMAGQTVGGIYMVKPDK